MALGAVGRLGPRPIPPNTDQLHCVPACASGTKLWLPPQSQCLFREHGARGRGAGCGSAATVYSLVPLWARDLTLPPPISNLHIGNNTTYLKRSLYGLDLRQLSHTVKLLKLPLRSPGKDLPLGDHRAGRGRPLGLGGLAHAHFTL